MSHTHTSINTSTPIYCWQIHTQTHTHKHTQSLSLSRTHTHTLYAYMVAYTHTHTHTHTHTRDTHTYTYLHRGRRNDMVKTAIKDLARSEHADLRFFDHHLSVNAHTHIRTYWSIKKTRQGNQYSDPDSDIHHQDAKTSQNGIMLASKEQFAHNSPSHDMDIAHNSSSRDMDTSHVVSQASMAVKNSSEFDKYTSRVSSVEETQIQNIVNKSIGQSSQSRQSGQTDRTQTANSNITIQTSQTSPIGGKSIRTRHLIRENNQTQILNANVTPKILHFIWVSKNLEGSNQVPEQEKRHIEAWASMHPSWQVCVCACVHCCMCVWLCPSRGNDILKLGHLCILRGRCVYVHVCIVVCVYGSA
jgi:hypothetical protein